MFSSPSSSCLSVRFCVPLNAMCSRKCAVPLLASVSNRDPASIHTPTVATGHTLFVSVATRIPFASVVTSVAGCGTRIGRWRGSALATLANATSGSDMISSHPRCRATPNCPESSASAPGFVSIICRSFCCTRSSRSRSGSNAS